MHDSSISPSPSVYPLPFLQLYTWLFEFGRGNFAADETSLVSTKKKDINNERRDAVGCGEVPFDYNPERTWTDQQTLLLDPYPPLFTRLAFRPRCGEYLRNWSTSEFDHLWGDLVRLRDSGVLRKTNKMTAHVWRLSAAGYPQPGGEGARSLSQFQCARLSYIQVHSPDFDIYHWFLYYY